MLVGRCSCELFGRELQRKIRKPQTPSEAEGSAVLLHQRPILIQSNDPYIGYPPRSINRKVEIHFTLRMMTPQSTSDTLNVPQHGLVIPAPTIRIGSQRLGDVS